MNNVNLLVATPMYGGQCTGPYMRSIMHLQEVLQQKGYRFAFMDMYNESLITRARNDFITEFINKSEFTHMMFIDADIAFNANDIIRMIECDKEIVCGVYSTKGINWELVANAVRSGVPANQLKYFTGSTFTKLIDPNFQPTDWDDLVEIAHGGTGFMLIRRDVVEKLKEVVPRYHTPEGQVKYNMFESSLSPVQGNPEKNDLLSEDYHFCKLWRENGGRVWAAPWVMLDHVGTYIFSGAFGRIPND